MRADVVLLLGVVLICVGMVLAFAGILASALFSPATWVILLGLLACGAAGVVALAVRSGEDRAQNR
ncbi:MAG: hypothetical protein GX539_07320 [Candidatus Cloacimonetes bacterium]|jgi:hypothetical protein|nr:hypothetical protein [Candidatus Cloacimonadota bacterium]